MSAFFDEVVDPDFLGTDIALAGGDLSANDHGDYTTTAGEENLAAARDRRLNTRKGSVAVIVEDVTGLLLLRSEMGNAAWRHLSQPMHEVGDMLADNIECLEQDDRITVADGSQRIVEGDDGFPRLVIDIDYAVSGTNQTATATVAFDPATGSFQVV